jgi:hypothetical protein
VHLYVVADRMAAPAVATSTARPGTFRSTVQPLVRSAATQGASVSELTRILQEAHGRAYRRVDMLADLRRYRPLEEGTRRSATAFARFVDPRRYIAQAGVAVFGVALLVPSLVHGATTPAAVIVAAPSDVPAVVEQLLPPLPDPVARAKSEPEPEAPPAPAPPPRPAGPAPSGSTVVASWYGPGFFENRLPCWQWLQAQGLPIQFLPDTWGVAHKSLPCGAMVTLTHGANVVTVPVVDRGPYIEGREFDLSPRVKVALGCTDLCTVVMHIR